MYKPLAAPRAAFLLLAAVSGCGDPGAGSSTATPQYPYNVLLLTVDTLRADHMSAYGYERETTPFLEQFAKQSAFFQYGIVQWPKTGPSMAAMMTSLYGSFTGVARKTGTFEVPEILEVLPEILQDAGFQTHAIITNSSLNKSLRYDQGFDEFDEFFYVDSDSGEQMTERSIQFMKNRDPARNFLLWSHYIDPHTPYQAPQEYRDLYYGDEFWRRDEGPSIEHEPEEWPDGKVKAASIGRIPRAAYIEGKNQRRDYVAEYDAEVRYFDDCVRDLIAWMEQEGLMKNTIIVFTSDHGESLGDHNYFFEHGRYPYDACSRVPLMIYHPDLAPSVIDDPVGLIDIGPTVLEALGIPVNPALHGKSVLSWIKNGGRGDEEERLVITEAGYRDRYCVSIRRGTWKLIYTGDLEQELGDQYQLFDLENDPLETRNLYAEETMVARSLQAILDREVQLRYAEPGLSSAVQQDPAIIEKLRALGYIDGE